MRHGTRRREGATRLGVFAVTLLAAALLLFTWPLVRAPRLHLVPAYLHLLVAWALVIAALVVMSRAVRRSRPRPGHRDA